MMTCCWQGQVRLIHPLWLFEVVAGDGAGGSKLLLVMLTMTLMEMMVGTLQQGMGK